MAFEKEQFGKAIEDYTRVILLDSADAAAYNNRGMSYAALGDYKRAVEDASQALKLDPGHINAVMTRADALSELGRYKEALADYATVLANDIEDAVAYNNRAWVYYKMARGSSDGSARELKKGLEDINRAITLVPDQGLFYDTRGYLRYRLGKYDMALADFNKALALKDDARIALHFGRAMTYEKLGKKDLAIADYRLTQSFAARYPDDKQAQAKAAKRLAVLEKMVVAQGDADAPIVVKRSSNIVEKKPVAKPRPQRVRRKKTPRASEPKKVARPENECWRTFSVMDCN